MFKMFTLFFNTEIYPQGSFSVPCSAAWFIRWQKCSLRTLSSRVSVCDVWFLEKSIRCFRKLTDGEFIIFNCTEAMFLSDLACIGRLECSLFKFCIVPFVNNPFHYFVFYFPMVFSSKWSLYLDWGVRPMVSFHSEDSLFSS